MEFSAGQPVRIPPPPTHIPAQCLHLRCPTETDLTAGQRVGVGQALIRPLPGRATVISPMDGVIRKITKDPHDQRGWTVVIDPTRNRVATSLAVEPPRERKLDDWIKSVPRLGAWAVRDGYVGLLAQLEAATENPPSTLICVGLDTFPPYPVRSSLVMSFPDDIVLGTLVLADVVGAKDLVMIASKIPAVLERLRPACKNFKLRLITKKNVYPAADPTLLVRAHSPGHRRLPVGANPVKEAGVMLVDPWTAILIGRWFTLEQFDLVRPVMVGWPHARSNLTVCYTLVGQPLASLDAQLADALGRGDPVILGNPMSGQLAWNPTQKGNRAIDAVVPNDELLVTVLDPSKPPQPETCISCGWCVEICPTGLRPNWLWDRCRRQTDQTNLAQWLQWCIDCGLCSHACPSSLPLAQTFHKIASGQKTR